jgi:hypothetical protein
MKFLCLICAENHGADAAARCGEASRITEFRSNQERKDLEIPVPVYMMRRRWPRFPKRVHRPRRVARKREPHRRGGLAVRSYGDNRASATAK